MNITSGMDVTIGEFDEVGNTIKELASEDANVVVGMAVDPDMHNELRVTIVATGLGQGVPAKQANTREREMAIPPIKLVQRMGDGEMYPRMDRSGGRQKAVGDGMGESGRTDADLEYLDIPAFLRRQAD